MTARQIFAAYYQGRKNVVTPEALGYYRIGPYAAEVSKGKGITDNTIYGVTVLHEDMGIIPKLCKLLPNYVEAVTYIESLQKRYKTLKTLQAPTI